MKALINLHSELVTIYGYQTEVCAALHQWNQFLKSARKSESQKLWFGRDDPNDPSAQFQYSRTFDYLIDASKRNSKITNTHRKSVVVLVYAVWEDQYRKRIADECGLPHKNQISSDVFYDLNKYRQAILHARGRLVKQPKGIDFFQIGDEVLLTDKHMYELFSLLIAELNRIGETYYGLDPQFSLDKPLNSPRQNRPR